MKVKTCIICFCLYVNTISAQTNEWELAKNKNGIKVYVRESPESAIKELKITLELSCTLSSAISVINDIGGMPDWVFNCIETKILDQESETSFTFSSTTDFPFLFSDRELVVRCTTYQDQKSCVVYSECSHANPEKFPHQEKNIRINPAISNWKLTPKGGGLIEAEYYLLADPGGNIPAFVVNWGLDYGPVQTIKKFKKRVQLEKYKDRRLAYIREDCFK